MLWTELKLLSQLSSPIFRTWQMGSLLGLLIILSITSSVFLIWESVQLGEFISALAARDGIRFQQSLYTLIAILLGSALLLSFVAFVRDMVGLQWRQGLTRQLLDHYLGDKSYYHLTQPSTNSSIDNPDQRLSEDIKLVSQTTLLVGVIALESAVQLVGFLGVLWAISKILMGVLVVYALAGTTIATFFFGKRLTHLNAEQLKREADFRFGLINLRENAESIAFYRGQQTEGMVLTRYFANVVFNFNRLIRWQLGLDFFQNGYQYLTFILPSIILAPNILAGQLEVGAIVQSQAAFDRIWLSLSLIVVQFEQVTTLAASIGRLGSLAQSLQTLKRDQTQSIQHLTSPTLSVQDLTVLTPDGHRCLVQDLSFEVPVGAGLLVMGPSGVGKSALMKTLAGLWTLGQGTLRAPTNSLFLPQQPYLSLGSLRQQLLYPHGNEVLNELTLRQVLNQVDLPQLTHMPLDTIGDWSQRLSLGEQQRLSFARLILQRPTYAILDEATSAVTLAQEQRLYQCLARTGITAVSVGHRPSLLSHHAQVLTLAPDQTWSLQSTQDYHFA